MGKELIVNNSAINQEQQVKANFNDLLVQKTNADVSGREQSVYRPDDKDGDNRHFFDASGKPYDARELMQVVKILDYVGLPRPFYKDVIPAYVATAHDLDVNIMGIGGLILLGTSLYRSAPDFKKAGISRRFFLFSAVTSAVIGITAVVGLGLWSRHLDEIENKYRQCEGVLPPIKEDNGAPLNALEFEKLTQDPFHAADFLLKGGYNLDWVKEQNLPMFLQRAVEAIKNSLPVAFAKLMSEKAVDTKKRLIITLTKQDYIARLLQFGISQKDADKGAEEDKGSAVHDDNGVSIAIVNAENIQDNVDPANRASETVRGISSNTAHELSHEKRRKLFSEKEKRLLISWINKAGLSGKSPVVEIIDGQEGLGIWYKREDGTQNIILGGDSGTGYAEMDEVIREWLERSFRQRLDMALNKTPPTRYDTYHFPFYVGYEALEYLNQKLGVTNNTLTDAINNMRTGTGPIQNIVDLVNFYTKAGRQNSNKNLTEEKVLKALFNIEIAVIIGLKNRAEYLKANSNLNFDDPFTEYVCQLKMQLELTKSSIDQEFDG